MNVCTNNPRDWISFLLLQQLPLVFHSYGECDSDSHSTGQEDMKYSGRYGFTHGLALLRETLG